MPGSLSFIAGQRETMEKTFLETEKNEQRWNRSDDRSGQRHAPIALVLRTVGDPFQRYLDELSPVVVDDHERPEILVPDVDELDHPQRPNHVPGDWEQDAPQKSQWPGAVNLRGFGQVSRDIREMLSEQKRPGCACQKGNDQGKDHRL